MTLRLAELTADNVQAACRIDVKPEQQKFVASVVESIAEAYVHYDTAWLLAARVGSPLRWIRASTQRVGAAEGPM